MGKNDRSIIGRIKFSLNLAGSPISGFGYQAIPLNHFYHW